MIVGLDDDLYCAHTPIPVRVTDVPEDVLRLQIYIGGAPVLTREPMLCRNLDGDFLIDLSPWVKQFMPSFKDNMTYTSTISVIPNGQLQEMTIELGNESVTKTFVNCATEEWRLVDDGFRNIKVWECYPFSYIAPDFLDLVYGVISEEPITADKVVEYNSDCCAGVYIKWINRYGYYSYWLFPPVYSLESSGDEYYRVNQSIFSADRDGADKTVGFEKESKITVRDKVSRKYYDMFIDLVTSPEVHMLRSDYVLGADVNPYDWVRLTQDSPDIEADNVNRTFEFEMDFGLPKKYTQTLI